MRSIRIAAIAAVMATAAGVVHAEDGTVAPDGWSSFKPGTTVTQRTTTRMGGDAGDQAPQEQRTTLVSVNDKEYVLKTEVKIMGEWHGSDVTIPRVAVGTGGPTEKGPTPEPMGEDKLSIDGQDFVCKKSKVTVQGATTVSWIYQDKDLLKSETTGPGEMKSSYTVTAIRKKVKVAGKELECRETKMTSQMGEGSDSSVVSLTNDTVPGRAVRSETSVRNPGMYMTTITEVTAYEVK